MGYCNDCGCRTSGGICSNCHEELYILENQYEYIESALSKDFMNKARQQAISIERNLMNPQPTNREER